MSGIFQQARSFARRGRACAEQQHVGPRKHEDRFGSKAMPVFPLGSGVQLRAIADRTSPTFVLSRTMPVPADYVIVA